MALGTKEYYKQKENKLQGKAIHRQHQFYHLSYGMMVGIYTSVVSVPSGSKLSLGDFMEVRKLEFPPGGSPETQPHQLRETFKMKDYAPRVFHQLRERFGIDRKEYLSSLGGAYQYIEFHSNSKSGQFFFFSHDGKFMIKTQTAEESKFLRRILLHYFKHCAQNPGTYLPRFYGMHRLKMKHLGNRKVHFVVMHSVFDSGDLPIHTMFDLKGSTIGRAAKPEEKARGPGKVVLKDLDLMEDGVKLSLGPRRRAAFLEQLRLDAAWLAAQQIMDYSLLLGIRDRHRPHVQGVKRQSVFVRADGGGAAGGGGG
jgi:1-phosphatidylinositol-4-phosphate 5-kinase